ncbi:MULTISPECIES: preprotein translocase subunit SecY [Methylorubrum]|jgi:preprotein translocase subunit SecY|uniref:Protein translocase subunit SecY n=5 Tax=Methylorubrum extorquens TaxID=408 RepID=C5APT2_METEA|nr:MULTISPECIES: preprotein translocase subunit SecY [Methylobacteriaceae]KQO86980.1 preprotein translocase subunit SecY [Methylobacterium sp. Leaf90]KQO94697.1 preprotein translocase subunit SecY [Methylobacterium sp. Leaf92]KQP87336.1 preprotein translocase subunit SecY [Methylobacterium sp. Leaf119]KQP99384.1 preprotein translocase subunit SecY [Methylobacterium sp. Leaf121]MBA9066306.1 preprotein translocase subunit SecY [Methylobacterium sp. RAS18]MDH6639146.1 preprotein translocase subu
MASAAEQLAANLNFGAIAKADELKKRIWFTLGALIVFRLGTYIPIPGIDPEQFARNFQNQAGGVLGMFNMFSGGAVERMAVFALNIMPYISASIIVQLLTSVVPTLEALKKEGESGRKVINQYTRYLTVVLALVQSWGIAFGLQGSNAVITPGPFFILSTVVTLTGGTLFLMWIGEQITSRGIGNGSSLIIFAGIVAHLPASIFGALELTRTGALSPAVLLGAGLAAVALIYFIVFMERAQRRLLINYPKRQVGNRMYEGQSSFLPLKLNTSGVIPPIFASSLLLLPTTVASFSANQGSTGILGTLTAYLGHGRPLYMVAYAGLIIFFTFFYTAIVFNPQETADNLKKQGGFIPGIRPGERTAAFIDKVLTRITVIGAAYLTFVCLVPEIVASYTSAALGFGGTSLLIVVSVTMDTVAQIHGHLMAHQYEGLVKKAKLRGASTTRRR